jgi:type I restriction enzyme S subunit
MDVPEGWEVNTFASLLKSGDILGIQDGNHGNDHPKANDYVDDGIPFVMARDLHLGTINTKTCSFIARKQADSLRIGFAKPGDVLLSHKGTIGEIAIVPEGFDYVMLTPQVTYYRVNLRGKIFRDYLFQYFRGDEFQSKLKILATQSTRSYLGITAQKELLIRFPPRHEQQKIAQILSVWDKSIEKLEALIAAKQKRKKALMQQLLTGKNRFSGFDGEWEQKRLDSLAKVFIGLVTTMTTNYVDCGVPLIRNSDIKQNKITKEKLIYLSQDFASANKERKLKTGDIVTVHTGEVGVSSVIDKELNGSIGFATLNTRLKSDEISPEYLCWYFNSEHFIQWCVAMSTGDGRQNLNLKDFVKSKIIFPGNIEEQQKIASVLSAANTEIQTHQKQLAALKQQKKCLMQQLLTGKKRVKVDSHV